MPRHPVNQRVPRISYHAFCRLRSGDMVWWHTKRGGYFRTVQTGPADDPLHNKACPEKSPRWSVHVTFAKRCRSRYPAGHTGYAYTDMKFKISFDGKRNRNLLVTPEEIERMVHSGFKVSKTLEYDLRRFESNPCRKVSQLKKDKAWCERVKHTYKTLKECGL